jgi:probable HAF family extracellular repeat protein
VIIGSDQPGSRNVPPGTLSNLLPLALKVLFKSQPFKPRTTDSAMQVLRTLSILLLAAMGLARGGAIFTITDIPTLGGNAAYADGIGPNGEVVGSSYTTNSAAIRGILWTPSGGLQDVGALPNGTSNIEASAINANGKIVGWAPINAGNSQRHAFVGTVGALTDIGTLGGMESFAYAINDAGRIVGQAKTVGALDHAFLYVPGSGMSDLGVLAGTTSYAFSINASGQIAGASTYQGGGSNLHAVLFQGGAKTDLGTLGGNYSSASAINASGAIVGSSNLSGNAISHAFLWTSSNGMQDLGTIGTGTISGATSINSSGDIVGSYADISVYPPAGHAFFYTKGVMRDLDGLIDASGWTIESANGINDRMQIAGYGFVNGSRHAFLLSPIPAQVELTGKKKRITTRPKFIMHGAASGYVTSITAQIGKKTLIAKGNESWSLIIPLKPGRNRVSLVAHGPGGDSSPARVTITRR